MMMITATLMCVTVMTLSWITVHGVMTSVKQERKSACKKESETHHITRKYSRHTNKTPTLSHKHTRAHTSRQDSHTFSLKVTGSHASSSCHTQCFSSLIEIFFRAFSVFVLVLLVSSHWSCWSSCAQVTQGPVLPLFPFSWSAQVGWLLRKPHKTC
jgi:hypothetical protein